MAQVTLRWRRPAVRPRALARGPLPRAGCAALEAAFRAWARRAARRQGLRGTRQAGRQPLGQLLAPAFADVQSKLRAAPQHVICRHGPLLRQQVGGLALEEAGAEMRAKPSGVPAGGKHLARERAIAANQTLRGCLSERWDRRGQFGRQARELVVGKIAARQRDIARPGRARRWKYRSELGKSLLGQMPVGRDLAANDGQQRRRTRGRLEVEYKIARRVLRRTLPIIIERANARIAPDHVGRLDRSGKILADPLAQVLDLLLGNADARGIAFKVDVGGADQRIVLFVRDGEGDAPVRVLKDVS